MVNERKVGPYFRFCNGQNPVLRERGRMIRSIVAGFRHSIWDSEAVQMHDEEMGPDPLTGWYYDMWVMGVWAFREK